MYKFYKRTSLAIVLVILIFAARQPASAQTGSTRHFPETGHIVFGEFLVKYESVLQPEFLYGYPITDAYIDPLTNLEVQYFQRARFEYNPQNSPGQRVQLTPLGSLTYTPNNQSAVDVTNTACEQERDWSFPVCYSFLDFYKDFGGVSQFGKPISGIEIQNERLVQYFENVRMEWHPENPTGAKTTIANLGTIFFHLRNEPYALLNPSSGLFGLRLIDLKVHVFSENALVENGEIQNLYVTVYDQIFSPVNEAQVFVQITYPSGQIISLDPSLTDDYGIWREAFYVTDTEMGSVIIQVIVSHSGIIETTETSFRLWN